MEVYAVARAHRLNRLLAFNSRETGFPAPATRTTEPGTLTDPISQALEAGTQVLTTDDRLAPMYVWLQPFCDGPPGSQFYMNVTGWNLLGTDPARQVWVPAFLVQMICSASNVSGPSGSPPGKRLLAENELMCDVLAPTLGTLGSGQINTPGFDYGAWAKVDLQNSQDFTVEFAGDGTFGMNTLWRAA